MIDIAGLEGRWQPIVDDEEVAEPLLFRGGGIYREEGGDRIGRYGLFEDELFVQFNPAPNGDATLLHLWISEIEGRQQIGGSEVIFADGAAVMVSVALARV